MLQRIVNSDLNLWSTLQWQGAMAGASGCFFIRAKEGKPQSENIHPASQACASANLIPRHNKKQMKQKLLWESVSPVFRYAQIGQS